MSHNSKGETKTYKYLLVLKGSTEILESTPEDVWQLIMNLKYPAAFISLTAMEEVDGPY